jgi:hypothetical protein
MLFYTQLLCIYRCPTQYRTRHFFNNSKFEQEYVRCVRNEEECVCSVTVVRLIEFLIARLTLTF